MGGMDSLRGHLLIANGNLFGSTFRQTVIVIADHDEDGALGYVLNQPSEMVVDRAALAAHLSAVEETVFTGGPVHPQVLTVLAEFDEPDGSPRIIFDAVGFLSIESPTTTPVRARVFAGYSGWGPGQLESELAENSWITAPATADLVFGDPSEMWQICLRALGGDYALMATMPYDPGMN